MNLEREDDIIVLSAPATMGPTIRSIPGARFDSRARRWTFPLSWGTCVTARGVLGPGMTVGPQLAAWARQERASRVDPCLELRDMKDVPPDWAARIDEVEAS